MNCQSKGENMKTQIEKINNKFFLDNWFKDKFGYGWKNISVYKTYHEALNALDELRKHENHGAK